MSYTHDAMIDLLIARPELSQKELAAHFGMNYAWISRVVRSDAFQARLAERKAQLVDPIITQSLEEKLKVAADKSLERLIHKMDNAPAMAAGDLELQVLSISTKALGMGARERGGPNQNNFQFVVNLPQKAASQEAWVQAHTKEIPHG